MSVPPQDFKNALAHWATGVTIVTTLAAGRPVGITASSLASVSLNPPQILICVTRKLFTHGAILSSGRFAVNILEKHQREWGMRFAGMIPEAADRFAGIAWRSVSTGSPILPDVLAWLDCRLSHSYDGDDHSIFVGEVLAAGHRADVEPLLYFNRHWRALEPGQLSLP